MNLFSKIKQVKIKGSILLSVVIVSGIIGAGIAGVNHRMYTRITLLEHERLNSIAMSLNKESVNVLTRMFSADHPSLVIRTDNIVFTLTDDNGNFGENNPNIRFRDVGNGRYQIQFFHDGETYYTSATTTISLNTKDLQYPGNIGDLVLWKANVKSEIVAISSKNYSYDYDVLLTLPLVRLNPQKQSCAVLIWTRGSHGDSIYARDGCSFWDQTCYNRACLYIPGLPNVAQQQNRSMDFNVDGGCADGSNRDLVINSYRFVHMFFMDPHSWCSGWVRDVDKVISRCGVREKLPAKYTYQGVEYQLLEDPNHNWFNDEDDNWWRNHPWWEPTTFENRNICGGPNADCVCFIDKYQTSPLVIDLKGDGIQYMGYSDPLYFDFGSGSKTATTWLYNTDTAGFLALDKDNDGMIKTGKELFGDLTNKNFKNGFEALKVYDKNKDNLIDDKDAVWNKLLIWNDLNRNAIGEKEELTFIKDTDIKSISLDYEQKREQPDPYNGSVSKQSSFAFKKDGTKLKVYDIYFMNVLNAEKLAKNKK